MHVGNLESDIRNQEFGALESGIQFKESDIEVPQTKMESSTLNPKFSVWNQESKTVVDSRLTWGDNTNGLIICFIYCTNSIARFNC